MSKELDKKLNEKFGWANMSVEDMDEFVSKVPSIVASHEEAYPTHQAEIRSYIQRLFGMSFMELSLVNAKINWYPEYDEIITKLYNKKRWSNRIQDEKKVKSWINNLEYFNGKNN